MAAALIAHGSTKMADRLARYKKLFRVAKSIIDPNYIINFIITKDGDSKTVLDTSSIALATVPAEYAQLSMGFVMSDAEAVGDPPAAITLGSPEAAALVTNRDPETVAEKPGANMYRASSADTPTIAAIHPGAYKLEDHPGDTSWQSADGATVVSWWQGGRYATSAQYWLDLFGPSASPPTWAGEGAECTTPPAQSAVLAGTTPYAYQSAIDGGSAAGALGISGVKLAYGVWVNGSLLADNVPALCNMVRHEPDHAGVPLRVLISLWGDVLAAGGGYAISNLVLRFRSFPTGANRDAGNPANPAAPSLISCPLVLPTGVATWFGGAQISGFLIAEEGGVPPPAPPAYACYGKFSPDGAQLVMYGVTSTDDAPEPTVNHPSSEHRWNGAFTVDIPAATPTSPVTLVLVRSTDAGAEPSFTQQTTTTVSGPAEPMLIPVSTTTVGATRLFKEPSGTQTAWSYNESYIQDWYGEKQDFTSPEPGTSTTNTTEKTYSDLLPCVDWASDSTLCSARSVRVAHRHTTTMSAPVNAKYINAHRYITGYYTSLPKADRSYSTTNSIYSGGSAEAQYAADVAWYIAHGLSTDCVLTETVITYYPNSPPTSVVTETNIGRVAGWGPGFGELLYGDDRGFSIFFYWIHSIQKTRRVGYQGEKICECHLPFPDVTYLQFDIIHAPPNLSILTYNGLDLRYWYDQPGSVTFDQGYYTTTSESGFQTVSTDSATVKQQYVLNGAAGEEAEYYDASASESGGLGQPSYSTFEVTVLPVNSEPLYIDPRWPILSLASEKPFTWDTNLGRRLYVGHVTDAGGTEIITEPNDPTQVLNVKATIDMAPVSFSYGYDPALSGADLASYLANDLPELLQLGVASYPLVPSHGGATTKLPLAPRSETGFERIYKYDISPDVLSTDKVLFGASWPYKWGDGMLQQPAAPEVWQQAGDPFPIALKGVYTDGVIYSAPIFLTPYRIAGT